MSKNMEVRIIILKDILKPQDTDCMNLGIVQLTAQKGS